MYRVNLLDDIYAYVNNTNHTFIPMEALHKLICKDENMQVAEIQELNNIVIKRMVDLYLYVSFDGFYALVDDDMSKLSLNHVKCMLKNDTYFTSKQLNLYLEALLKYAKEACDNRINTLVEYK